MAAFAYILSVLVAGFLMATSSPASPQAKAGASFEDKEWRSSQLQDASFFQANLRGTRWHEARCERCDLRETDARAARVFATRFVGTDFRGSRWAGALLAYSAFRECDFRGADLAEVLWVGSRCVHCRADASTRLPWPRAQAEAMGFEFR